MLFFFFFQAEDGIRDLYVTGVQTCALPIFLHDRTLLRALLGTPARYIGLLGPRARTDRRSEEHTSELQSRRDLVCRLLLEKKKKKKKNTQPESSEVRRTRPRSNRKSSTITR